MGRVQSWNARATEAMASVSRHVFAWCRGKTGSVGGVAGNPAGETRGYNQFQGRLIEERA